MRLKSKIFFGFLFISLIFTGGGLFCLKALGPIERSFEQHASENLPVLNASQNIRTLGSMLHAEMLELSYLLRLEITPETRQALQLEQAEIKLTRSQLLAEMQKYRKLVELYFPEESHYIPLLQTQIDQLILMIDDLQRRMTGQASPFSLEMKTRFENLEQSFLAVTNEIVSYEVNEIQMRRETVNNTITRARLLIGVSLTIAFGLALLLTRWLTLSYSSLEPSGATGRRLRRGPRRNTLRDGPP